MELLFICRYCDHKWRKHVYSNTVTDEKCLRCGDTNIDVKELSKARIDSYIGCPPFPEKPIEKDIPFWRRGD